MGFGGVNLTIPHKEVAFRGLEKLDASARLLGAVNTVQFTEDGPDRPQHGRLRLPARARRGLRPQYRGATGVRAGQRRRGPRGGPDGRPGGRASVTLADLDHARSERVGEEIRAVPGVAVTVVSTPVEQAGAAGKADLVVQATPVGMKKTM
jgi:shikimate 5-dehydrogenase